MRTACGAARSARTTTAPPVSGHRPCGAHGHLAPPSLVKDGRDISTALRPSLSGSVHGLSGSEPRKQIRLWWLDGPHTLDTLEGFIGPEPAAHQLEHPDEVPQAAHLTPVGT